SQQLAQPSQQLPQPSQQLPRPTQQPSQQLPQPSQQLPRPGIAAPVPPNRPAQPPRSPRPGPPPQSMPSGAFPMSGGPMAPHGTGYMPAPPPPVRPPEAGLTEQMPRVPPAPPAAPRNATGTHQVPTFPPAPTGFGPSGGAPPAEDFTELAPGEDQPADDYEDYPDGPEFGGPDDYPDDDLGEDDDLDERAPSAGREWLIMVAQVALSVVGGAAVWLGFNWLWGRYPQAALGAAVVVIIGLVWIVRKIRRADDMQTTLLAILVGLFVTVSPAALLLLSK
ncbi:MAG TPA: hypothetical protein VFO68_30070, partial [Actinophytocola sp.]|nr:hypothetical protein [Actinophytocola sp.]